MTGAQLEQWASRQVREPRVRSEAPVAVVSLALISAGLALVASAIGWL